MSNSLAEFWADAVADIVDEVYEDENGETILTIRRSKLIELLGEIISDAKLSPDLWAED